MGDSGGRGRWLGRCNPNLIADKTQRKNKKKQKPKRERERGERERERGGGGEREREEGVSECRRHGNEHFKTTAQLL